MKCNHEAIDQDAALRFSLVPVGQIGSFIFPEVTIIYIGNVSNLPPKRRGVGTPDPFLRHCRVLDGGGGGGPDVACRFLEMPMSHVSADYYFPCPLSN